MVLLVTRVDTYRTFLVCFHLVRVEAESRSSVLQLETDNKLRQSSWDRTRGDHWLQLSTLRQRHRCRQLSLTCPQAVTFLVYINIGGLTTFSRSHLKLLQPSRFLNLSLSVTLARTAGALSWNSIMTTNISCIKYTKGVLSVAGVYCLVKLFIVCLLTTKCGWKA